MRLFVWLFVCVCVSGDQAIKIITMTRMSALPLGIQNMLFAMVGVFSFIVAVVFVCSFFSFFFPNLVLLVCLFVSCRCWIN